MKFEIVKYKYGEYIVDTQFGIVDAIDYLTIDDKINFETFNNYSLLQRHRVAIMNRMEAHMAAEILEPYGSKVVETWKLKTTYGFQYGECGNFRDTPMHQVFTDFIHLTTFEQEDLLWKITNAHIALQTLEELKGLPF